MLNKKQKKLFDQFVYLSEEEIERCWRQAVGFTKSRGFRGGLYWSIVSRTARKLANKLEQERIEKDLEDRRLT